MLGRRLSETLAGCSKVSCSNPVMEWTGKWHWCELLQNQAKDECNEVVEFDSSKTSADFNFCYIDV